MNYYKITFYVISFVILIFLLYTLYNYIKPKALATKALTIEPFYDNDTGPPEFDFFYIESQTFFDIVETYDYENMKYLWYSMPYYNEKVTIENEEIVIPESYFKNNDKPRLKDDDQSIMYPTLQNANGIFGKYIAKNDDTINYTGAAIILARPNIHRINLKNFILLKGNAPDGFDGVDMKILKDTYNVLYKINFWYNTFKRGFYDNDVIGDAFDSKVTGFDYVNYIYNPITYTLARKNSFYLNYVNKYRSFMNSHLGSDYYKLNTDMAIINDIYIDKLNSFKLEYSDSIYPYEKYKSDNSDHPYSKYLSQLAETYDFKFNVNAASKIIMQKTINVTSITAPGPSSSTRIEPDFNNIFENTSFKIPQTPGDSTHLNEMQSILTDYFNNFYILNALYALYVDRYYYVDLNYYNEDDTTKSTLSFSNGEFKGGETFTTTYNDWLTGIGIYKSTRGVDYTKYINTDGTEFIENAKDFDNFKLLYYNKSPYEKTGSVIRNGYYDTEVVFDNFTNPIIPISKLYRGNSYFDAINLIDEDEMLKKSLIKDMTQLEYNKNVVYPNTEKRIVNILKNMLLRIKLSTAFYGAFNDGTSTFYLQEDMNKTTINDETNKTLLNKYLYSYKDLSRNEVPSYLNDAAKIAGDKKYNYYQFRYDFPAYRLTKPLDVNVSNVRGFAAANELPTVRSLDDPAATTTSTTNQKVTVPAKFIGIPIGGRSKIEKATTVKSKYTWMSDPVASIFDSPVGAAGATLLLDNKLGVGVDAIWYDYVIQYGMNLDTYNRFINDGNFKELESPYKGYLQTLFNNAKNQVTQYMKNFSKDTTPINQYEENSEAAYWKYPLVKSDTVGEYKTLGEMLVIELKDYKKYHDYDTKDYSIKKYYKTAVSNYNNMYKTVIPKLIETTIDNLKNRISQINSFDSFMKGLGDFIDSNYKWEDITKKKSINRITNVKYNGVAIINNENSILIPELFKYINRTDIINNGSENTTSYVQSNVVPISSLMPALVYFLEPSNSPTSDNPYNDKDNDYLIYSRSNENSIRYPILSVVNAFAIDIFKPTANMKSELERLIRTTGDTAYNSILNNVNNAYNTMNGYITYDKRFDKNFTFATFTSFIKAAVTTQNDLIKFVNKNIISWKKTTHWNDALNRNFLQFSQAVSHLTEFINAVLPNNGPNIKTLNALFNRIDNTSFDKIAKDIIKDIIKKSYYSNVKAKMFDETDSYSSKDTNRYNDIFNHPKILMIYNEPFLSDKKNEYSIFDIGIILRFMFNYDITNYIDKPDTFTNYNFPTLFQYNSNDVINIPKNTDVLSDINYNNLSINSKLNNFFDKVDYHYNAFLDYVNDISYANVPIDYFNFVKSETALREEATTILNKMIDNSYNLMEIIQYSYTNNFISSINCLYTMYTDDVCNIIFPLYEHFNDTFNKLIYSVYDFNSPEFKNITATISNKNFLKNDVFKDFFKQYTGLFKLLNSGAINQSKSPGNSPGVNDEPSKLSGMLIYLFNIHNSILNLILRAFYYYNNYIQLIKKYGKYVSNDFNDISFENNVNDDKNVFSQKKKYIVNGCNIFSKNAYEDSLFAFLKDALILYKTKIVPCCYNHILVNVTNVIQQLNETNLYIYNSDPNLKKSQIEKGEILKRTMLLYKNMLNTLDNGQLYIDKIDKDYKYISGNVRISGGWDWSIGKLYYNKSIFEDLNNTFNNYLNSVFYIGNAKLYGCFEGDVSNYYSSLGLSKYVDNNSNKIKEGKESKLISYVNNMDTNGKVTPLGAIANCINDTNAHNNLINNNNNNATPGTGVQIENEPYDLVTIFPYNKDSSNTNSTIDMYACYAGKSSNFKKKANEINAQTVGLTYMDKCSFKYTDNSGNVNPDFNNNLMSNTVIYKLDTTNTNDSNEVAFLGCYKKNIPEMGLYNTLPNFIGNISGSSYTKPTDLMQNMKRIVDTYNSNFGTNYDIYGITNNLENTLELDIYAGDSKVDATYATYIKNDAYQENCNINYPGTENYMIYQNKSMINDACVTTEVNYVKNYTSLLTEYLNLNIQKHQETINEMGVDLNLLKNFFPIKFSISRISNTKDNADLSIDTSNSTGFDSIDSSNRMCALRLTVKEGPKGMEGDPGIPGKMGENIKGPPGDIGNAGYWGKTKNE